MYCTVQYRIPYKSQDVSKNIILRFDPMDIYIYIYIYKDRERERERESENERERERVECGDFHFANGVTLARQK